MVVLIALFFHERPINETFKRIISLWRCRITVPATRSGKCRVGINAL